jgi:hypothetical protein
MIVNNDGLHGSWEESGEVALKAGKHPVTVLMFQRKGGKKLEVLMEVPNVPKQVISPAAFFCFTERER